MKGRAFLVLSFLVLGSQGRAADGSSGCGPGWYVLKENSMVSSALRYVTNGILFPISTLGMTFGTSNCTQHKLVKTEQQSLHFATMNYFELKSEMAKGQGPYLAAMAATIGCPQQIQGEFNQQLKQSYKQVTSAPGVAPELMLTEIYKVILTHPELTAKCSLSPT